ncbi:MAG: glycosyltransferase family protein, partial [Granulosicoccaceae bacterium]
GRERHGFFDMDVFGDYWHREGLSLQSVDGRVDVKNTLRDLRMTQFLRDVRSLPVEKFDAVVCDYEPVSAWAARLAGVPSIGVGHQYALGGQAPSAGLDPTLSVLLRAFAPVNHRLGLHWQPYAEHIAPPIVDTRMVPTESSGRVVVYLPWEAQDKTTAMLKRLRGYEFVQFSGKLEDGQDGNVHLRKANVKGFKQELCGARGVICNAGFELVSEALFLGKPVLAKPVLGQGEQQGNAVALEQAGLGRRAQTLELSGIADWLARPRSVEAQAYPNVAIEIAQWLQRGQWADTATLAASLWSEDLLLNATPPRLLSA